MRRLASCLFVLSIGLTPPLVAQDAGAQDSVVFDHTEHRGLFPSCVTCHAGAAEAGMPMVPSSDSCTVCHDGVIQPMVDYRPTDVPRRTNVSFSHDEHFAIVAAVDSNAVDCMQCHSERDADWMAVEFAEVNRCLTCHGETAGHYDVPDASCANCHITLANANGLTYEDVSGFPIPSSHSEPGFANALHGPASRATSPDSIAASCSTCHARNFCITCHVDAPEQATIQALAEDFRSLAHGASLPIPLGHAERDFLSSHGAESLLSPQSCLTCHTRENCTTCHVATPEVASTLYGAAPGRGSGPEITRESPQSHDALYRTGHATEATTVPMSCAGCHARQDCLDCHLPDAAMGPSGYHDPGFLTRHASAAYHRETTCSECHNDRGFCASCHSLAGLASPAGEISGAGYHDAKRGFSLGHGVAARQNLETCVTCHVERDCLACHSATGARRFSPHGPGFDAERLRERNPEMCTACHTRIPNM